jgi:hypothetical protein
LNDLSLGQKKSFSVWHVSPRFVLDGIFQTNKKDGFPDSFLGFQLTTFDDEKIVFQIAVFMYSV